MYAVTQKALERFVNEKGEKYSEEFVKGLFKTLKCIFDYAYRKRYMKHNIFDDVLPLPIRGMLERLRCIRPKNYLSCINDLKAQM